MKIISSFLLTSILALPSVACKKDRDDSQTSPKAVEHSEKAAMEQKDDVIAKRADVAEAQAQLDQQKAELQKEDGQFAQARDEFVAKAKDRMAVLSTRVQAIKEDFQANATAFKVETRENLNAVLQKLDTQAAQVATSFQAATAGTKERWNDLEKNTGEALADLESSADDAVGKLKDAGVKVRAEATAGAHH